MNDPIPPSRFAAALQDLPLSTLALKVAELRNSIAHLDYSNEQLQPFARQAEPDRDCVEAIEENEIVIGRMRERIGLVKVEVERRGASWREIGFMVAGNGEEGPGKEVVNGDGDVDVNGGGDGDMDGIAPAMNGVSAVGVVDGSGTEARRREDGVGRHSAWTDGTFQTGTINGGAVVTDQTRSGAQGRQGGTLGDEELRRRLEERMHASMDDEDEGMHL